MIFAEIPCVNFRGKEIAENREKHSTAASSFESDIQPNITNAYLCQQATRS